MIRRFLIISVLVFIAVLPCTAAVAQRRVKEKQVRELPSEVKSPQAVFRRLEGAWKSGNAKSISSMVGKKKAFIHIRGAGANGGFYSRSQVFYLFKRMFKEYRHLKFEFVKFHNLDRPDRRVYAIAYRSCKIMRSDKVFQDKVYITLGREGQDWVVTEIKTTR
ncbi:MAG: hypothetical protein KAV42_06310 [Candidatus Krumholzibacteria bacterium]|nr:hypothetical protein [Candidatus Krumholzibacteria bacterium]